MDKELQNYLEESADEYASDVIDYSYYNIFSKGIKPKEELMKVIAKAYKEGFNKAYAKSVIDLTVLQNLHQLTIHR